MGTHRLFVTLQREYKTEHKQSWTNVIKATVNIINWKLQHNSKGKEI